MGIQPKMAIEQFAFKEKERVDRFVKYYREMQQTEDPDDWPEDMHHAEWEEQYQSFIDSEEPGRD